MSEQSPELVKALSQIRMENSERDVPSKDPDLIPIMVSASNFTVKETYSYRCCICRRRFKEEEIDNCLED